MWDSWLLASSLTCPNCLLNVGFFAMLLGSWLLTSPKWIKMCYPSVVGHFVPETYYIGDLTSSYLVLTYTLLTRPQKYLPLGSWGTYIALALPKIASVGFLISCLVTQNIFPRLPKIASVGLSYRHFRCLSRAWEFKLQLTALKGKGTGHWVVWVSTQLVVVDTPMKEGVPLRLKLHSHMQVKYM
jgi:hypothetical protein